MVQGASWSTCSSCRGVRSSTHVVTPALGDPRALSLWLPWAPAHTCVYIRIIKNSKSKSFFKGHCNFQFGCSPLSHLYWWKFGAPWFCNNEFFHFSGHFYLCASPSPPLPPPPCYISLKGLLSLRRTWIFLLSTNLAFLCVRNPCMVGAVTLIFLSRLVWQLASFRCILWNLSNFQWDAFAYCEPQIVKLILTLKFNVELRSSCCWVHREPPLNLQIKEEENLSSVVW